MTTTINSNSATQSTLQVGGNNSLTFGTGIYQGNKNKIINGSFGINQRVYVSGAATTVGQYTLDRWKVTTTAGVTFATSANKTTVTIPAGQTIQQVIEGLNLETATYILSWEGTAQGRINAGAYGATGTVTAAITGGTNTTIEFNTGTVTNVQLEVGTVATPFEYRLYGTEFSLCQRYYQDFLIGSGVATGISAGVFTNTTTGYALIKYERMRITPTITWLGSGTYTCSNASNNYPVTAVTTAGSGPTSTQLQITVTGSPVANLPFVFSTSNTSGSVQINAEL